MAFFLNPGQPVWNTRFWYPRLLVLRYWTMEQVQHDRRHNPPKKSRSFFQLVWSSGKLFWAFMGAMTDCYWWVKRILGPLSLAALPNFLRIYGQSWHELMCIFFILTGPPGLGVLSLNFQRTGRGELENICLYTTCRLKFTLESTPGAWQQKQVVMLTTTVQNVSPHCPISHRN